MHQRVLHASVKNYTVNNNFFKLFEKQLQKHWNQLLYSDNSVVIQTFLDTQFF